MESTRRSFLKKMTVAGIGTAGLALSGNTAAAATEMPAGKKKKPAGKDDGKLDRFSGHWTTLPSSTCRHRRFTREASMSLRRC